MELLTKTCTRCGAIFRTDDELSRHDKFHKLGEKEKKADSGDKPFNCSFY